MTLEILGYLAALGAATCWAFGSLLSVGPVRALGPIPFNTLRMFMVACMLTLWIVITGSWVWPSNEALWILIISGFIGIFLGDTLLFTSVKVLGPRMAGLLFATNAPLTFVLGVWLFNESYSLFNFIGVIAVMGGVFTAIAARAKAGDHHWEQSVGHVGLGLLAGFGAAVCQSMGVILIADMLDAGQDPVFATMLRVWVAVLFLALTMFATTFSGGYQRYKVLTKLLVGKIALSGFLGMALGMSLYLTGVALAPMGMATILSATTPVIILPIIWIFSGERPSMTSFFAGTVVVIGASLIFLTR